MNTFTELFRDSVEKPLEHAVSSEGRQSGQPREVSVGETHQEVLQEIEHRRDEAERHRQSEAEDEEREILQSDSRQRQQGALRSDDDPQSREEGQDVDREHPGCPKDRRLTC